MTQISLGAGRRLATGILAAVLAMTCVTTAHAQQTTTGQPVQPVQSAQQPQQPQVVPQVAQPYRGLFGAGIGAQPGGHRLDLLLSVSEEYGNSDDVASPGLVLSPGWFTAARGELSFEKAGQRSRFGLRTEGSARYYQDTRETTDPRFRVGTSVAVAPDLRRATTLNLDASYEFLPYYVLPLFANEAPMTGGTAILPTNRDDLNYANRRDVFAQAFSVDHDFSPRTTFGVFEDIRYTKATGDAADTRIFRAGARFGRRFSRYSALRLGYAYRRGDFGVDVDQRFVAHDIDISFDYRRPLPRSRRTTFSFSTGSSLVTVSPVERWEIVGTVGLRHDFDWGWFIRADFNRNTRLVEGFENVFFENTVSGSLGGFFSRRVEFLASGGYSRGEVSLSRNRYTALQGAARLRLALARHLAVDIEGLNDQHDFDERVVVPGTLPPRLARWAARCTVSIWLPLSR